MPEPMEGIYQTQMCLKHYARINAKIAVILTTLSLALCLTPLIAFRVSPYWRAATSPLPQLTNLILWDNYPTWFTLYITYPALASYLMITEIIPAIIIIRKKSTEGKKATLIRNGNIIYVTQTRKKSTLTVRLSDIRNIIIYKDALVVSGQADLVLEKDGKTAYRTKDNMIIPRCYRNEDALVDGYPQVLRDCYLKDDRKKIARKDGRRPWQRKN